MQTIRTSCFQGMEKARDDGWPTTLDFTLVLERLAVDPANPDPGELNESSVFADLTELSWTGFARISKALPAPVDGVSTIVSNVEFLTGSATDGPVLVPTVAALYPTTHELIALWDVEHYNGGPVDMSVANALLRLLQPIELFELPLTEVV